MAYATVATGFKGGGYNGGFGNTPLARRPFDSEDVISYEVGAKTEWGGRVRLNAAAFLADYDDFQSASFIRRTTLSSSMRTARAACRITIFPASCPLYLARSASVDALT